MENLFLEENKEIKESFNLDEILEFQLEHDLQIYKEIDLSYMCQIDDKAFGSSLTPIGALVFGIKQYKKYYGIK